MAFITLCIWWASVQVIFSRLSQERRDAASAGVSAASRESAWLVLELVGALERAVAHAAEGHVYRETLAQPVLAFFAANKKVGASRANVTKGHIRRLALLCADVRTKERE